MAVTAPSHLLAATPRSHKFCSRIVNPKEDLEQIQYLRGCHSTLAIIMIGLPKQDQRLPRRRILEQQTLSFHRHHSGVQNRTRFHHLLRGRIQSASLDAEGSEDFFGQHFGHFGTM
jgi:hypothetical protein